MDIRIYLFAIILLVGLFYRFSGETKRKRERYIDIILLLLVLESCLRGLSVGSDTYLYSEIFKEVQQQSWREVFQEMIDRYIYHSNDSDAGYVLLQKIVHVFSHNFNFFLLICALFFFIPFRKLLLWIDLDLDSLILVFVFYVALFNPIALSGTRKVISLGLTILAFLYYVDKRYGIALLWLIIATLIHMTSLAMLIVPIIDVLSNPFKKVLHGISFLFIPIMILFSSSIIMFMAVFVENEHYQLYAQDPEGGGMTFVILIEIIFLACFILFKKSDLHHSNKLSHLYAMLPIATVLAPLITNNGSMIRLSQLFHIYVLVLLPILVNKITNAKTKTTLISILIIILIVLCLRTDGLGSHYYFFWNDNMPIESY